MDRMVKEKNYAWYSEKQHKRCGYIKWKRTNGEEVIATHISSSPILSNTKWDDIVCLGEVNTFISSHWNQEVQDIFNAFEDEAMEKISEDTMTNNLLKLGIFLRNQSSVKDYTLN